MQRPVIMPILKDHKKQLSRLDFGQFPWEQRHAKRNFQVSSNCQLCSQDHKLRRYKDYFSRSLADHQQLVRDQNLRLSCLKRHERGLCNSTIRCGLNWCDWFHHPTIHQDEMRNLQRSDFQAARKVRFYQTGIVNLRENFNQSTSQSFSATSNEQLSDDRME